MQDDPHNLSNRYKTIITEESWHNLLCPVARFRNLAIVDPFGLPSSFLQNLKELKVQTIEVSPTDDL